MNEQVARDVVLVRAVESADSERVIFTDDDRIHASRAAAELARWQAAEQRKAPSAEIFLGERARLLVQVLPRRAPMLARVAHAFEWRSWIGIALPAAAFIIGAVVEHIADRGHVNILAFPLFAMILWNVIVYAMLLLRLAMRVAGARTASRGPRRWLTQIAQRSGGARRRTMPESVRVFVAQWGERVAPLMAARSARVLHVSAATLALGAIVGLYVRGLVFQYRAGWESTFLDAPEVYAVLSFVLTPGAYLIGVPIPDVQTISAMRFVGDAQVAGASDGALWIHLYAVTVGAVVVVPRLALAAMAAWQEQQRSRFVLDLAEPYFRRLAAPFARGAASLRVVPYSYAPDETTLRGLRAVATGVLGDGAELVMDAPVAFGEENSARLAFAGSPSALTLALFSMAATPETENHGEFLKALRSSSTVRVAALIDESAFRRRLGGNIERLAERRSAWQAFCQALGVDAACVDLATPDLALIERDLAPSLAAQHA